MTFSSNYRIGVTEMPFIVSKVNVPISAEQERALKEKLGKAIELVPGKSEESLLLSLEDCCHLYLRGDKSQSMAYLTVSIFGNEGHAGYPAFTAEVTKIYGEVLGVAPENCYLKFDDITAWGVGGQYIDRRMFR